MAGQDNDRGYSAAPELPQKVHLGEREEVGVNRQVTV